MHDAHAAQAARQAVRQEFGDDRGRLVAGQPVQVDAVLDRPVAAAQLAQHLARHALAQVAERLAGLERFVGRERAAQAFGERRGLVAPALMRDGRGRRALQRDAPGALERA